MPSAHELRLLSEVLLECVDDHAGISGLEIASVEDRRSVTIRTTTPGRVIGRRGATAQVIRDELAARLGDPQLRLNIEEEKGPDDGPWRGHGGGFVCRCRHLLW
jgi:ribosomal protein S3